MEPIKENFVSLFSTPIPEKVVTHKIFGFMTLFHEAAILGSVNRRWNLATKKAIYIDLKIVQDALIEENILEADNRLNFDMEDTSISDSRLVFNKAIDRVAELICKHKHLIFKHPKNLQKIDFLPKHFSMIPSEILRERNISSAYPLCNVLETQDRQEYLSCLDLIGSGNFQAAIFILSKIKDPKNKDKCLAALAIQYIKNNKIPNALNCMRKITHYDNNFRIAALKLLQSGFYIEASEFLKKGDENLSAPYYSEGSQWLNQNNRAEQVLIIFKTCSFDIQNYIWLDVRKSLTNLFLQQKFDLLSSFFTEEEWNNGISGRVRDFYTDITFEMETMPNPVEFLEKIPSGSLKKYLLKELVGHLMIKPESKKTALLIAHLIEDEKTKNFYYSILGYDYRAEKKKKMVALFLEGHFDKFCSKITEKEWNDIKTRVPEKMISLDDFQIFSIIDELSLQTTKMENVVEFASKITDSNLRNVLFPKLAKELYFIAKRKEEAKKIAEMIEDEKIKESTLILVDDCTPAPEPKKVDELLEPTKKIEEPPPSKPPLSRAEKGKIALNQFWNKSFLNKIISFCSLGIIPLFVFLFGFYYTKR